MLGEAGATLAVKVTGFPTFGAAGANDRLVVVLTAVTIIGTTTPLRDASES